MVYVVGLTRIKQFIYVLFYLFKLLSTEYMQSVQNDEQGVLVWTSEWRSRSAYEFDVEVK